MRRISPKLCQVLRLVGKGLSNKEIAGDLHLSVGTVRVYVSRLYSLLRFRSRVEMALWANEIMIGENQDSSTQVYNWFMRLETCPSISIKD